MYVSSLEKLLSRSLVEFSTLYNVNFSFRTRVVDTILVLYCVVHQNLKAWHQARGEILPFQNNAKKEKNKLSYYSLHTSTAHVGTSRRLHILKSFRLMYHHSYYSLLAAIRSPAHMLWLTAHMLWLKHAEPNPCSTWTGTWQPECAGASTTSWSCSGSSLHLYL